MLRIYALGVFGYITTSIASYFIGHDAEDRQPAEHNGHTDDPQDELAYLRDVLAAMRGEIIRLRNDPQVESADFDT
ncbi:hypothetical protein BH23CHL4_BH23CHL4_20650 [soil metagenome]